MGYHVIFISHYHIAGLTNMCCFTNLDFVFRFRYEKNRVANRFDLVLFCFFRFV